MTDELDRVRKGVIGEFVPVIDPPPAAYSPGYLTLDDEGVSEVVILLSEEAEADPSETPSRHSVIAGYTEVGSVLLPTITRWESSHTFGGPMSAVCRYQSNQLLVGVVLEDVWDDHVAEVQLCYPGLNAWAGDNPLEEDVTPEDAFWRGTIRRFPPTSTDVSTGLTLSFGRRPSVAGAFDARSLNLPMAITVSCDGRRPLGELLVVLDSVHALLSLAHRHDVRATEGRAKLTSGSEWAAFWDHSMMAVASEPAGFAVFGLEHLGGIDAVGRWVQLCDAHRRAVAPIVSHRLFTNQTPESRLLATCAAMEYWVASSRQRGEEWAKYTKGEVLARAVVPQLDTSFDTWVGGAADWADRIWNAYNQLKHDPGAQLDAVQVHHLELAGRWALTGLLLDSCAQSTEVSRHLFGRSLWQTGAGVRQALK